MTRGFILRQAQDKVECCYHAHVELWAASLFAAAEKGFCKEQIAALPDP